MLPVYQAVTDWVAHEVGCTAELTVEGDYGSCISDVNDVCFVCSLPYVMFQRQGIGLATPVAAPVLEGDRYGGRPVYFSDVIVRADSTFHSLEDLRGHSWAYNEPLSQSGYGITRYTMVQRGLTGGFFGRVVEAGFHEKAIRLVVEGAVDGAAIDSQVLAIEFRDHPELAEQLRVADVLGPSTIQPIAVSNRLSLDLRERIRAALVGMHEEPDLRKTLGRGLISRFVAVGPEAYDDVRHMVDVCESVGYTVLR